MPTTRVTTIQATVAGVQISPLPAGDVANGINFVPNAGLLVLLQNPGGSSATATFVTPAVRQGLAVADDPVVVPAGAIVAVSIQNPGDFLSSAGQIDVTLSAALNIAVIQA